MPSDLKVDKLVLGRLYQIHLVSSGFGFAMTKASGHNSVPIWKKMIN